MSKETRYRGSATYTFDMETRFPNPSVTILHEAPEAFPRSVNGEKHLVVPFVGTAGTIIQRGQLQTRINTSYTRLGAGVIVPDAGNQVFLYGPINQRRLIQSYRAAELIAGLEEINLDSIAAAYNAARSDIVDPQAMRVLAAHMPNGTNVGRLRERVLDTAPSIKSLDAMIGILGWQNISGIDIQEIRDELERGSIQPTYLVTSLIGASPKELPAA